MLLKISWRRLGDRSVSLFAELELGFRLTSDKASNVRTSSRPAMAPSKKPGNKKKEKVFHPQSRKADQLVRAQIRKSKLSDLAKARTQKQHEIGVYPSSNSRDEILIANLPVDIFAFFYHAIPPEGVLTLEDLHTIVRDIWLTRYDSELESERAARRKGRPKSVKEIKLEDLKLREAEVYRTGMGESTHLRHCGVPNNDFPQRSSI